MKHLSAIGLMLALAACGGPTSTAQSGLASSANDANDVNVQVSGQAKVPTNSNLADLVERVGPMVVNITTVAEPVAGRDSPFDFFFPEGAPRPRQRQGAGTGFIIDGGGFIITNAHVVQGATEVQVRLHDDRELRAVVVGRDRKLDLALLRLDEGVSSALPQVTLGSSEALRVGEQVLAVGNPFGLGHTVTMGIVSAKDRTIGAGPYDDFIQTDASINPGNSGGPLFNLRGEVVGINTAIRAGADGIGFAIPVDALKDIVAQLRNKGFVDRGKLGLAFQPVTAAIAKAVGLERARGAMVSEILRGSSADKAGVRPGDVIIRINDTDINRAEELPRNVARHAPGSKIKIHLMRARKKRVLTAQLDKLEADGERRRPNPAQRPRNTPSGALGIDMEDHPNGGVRVTRVSGEVEGLAVGDRIIEVNGKKVNDTAQLRKQLKRVRSNEAALVKVLRSGRPRYVGIPLDR